MNEDEKEILLSKVVTGDLTPDENLLWQSACERDAKLGEKATELKAVSARLEGMVATAEWQADALPSGPLPADVLNRLEEARESIFSESTGRVAESSSRNQSPTQTQSWWREATEKLSEWTALSVPALAAAAVLMIGLVSVVFFRFGGSPSGPLIVMKDPVANPGLTIVSPGENTALLDPTVMWQAFPVAQADVTFFTADGKTKLFSATGRRVKASWEKFETGQKSKSSFLEADKTYLLRITQGELVSERIVRVSKNAKTAEAWEQSEKGALGIARRWMNEDRPEDALMLTAIAAAADKTRKSTADSAEIRTKAFQMILQKNGPDVKK